MFRVGQKVECIDARNQENFLTKGAVYIITSISDCGGYVRVDGASFGHYHGRFRPIVERKTDIGVFEEIIRKASAPALGDIFRKINDGISA